MARLVVTHGRSQEFGIPQILEREWADALRWGLERVDAPFHADIPITFAFYGDYWRPDAIEGTRSIATEPPTELQHDLAAEIIAAAPAGDREAATATRGFWDSVSSLVGTLDGVLGIGEATLQYFVREVDRYFDDDELRHQAIQRVVDAVITEGDEVVLLAHSLGSIVAYDTLRAHPDLPVRGLVTFGSPLGLQTVRSKLEETGDLAFPFGISRWVNVYEPRDLVAANRELADLYTADDGRRVEDIRSEGRGPGVTDLTAAHDAIVYLSSTALAGATREIVEAIETDPGDSRWVAALPQAVPPPEESDMVVGGGGGDGEAVADAGAVESAGATERPVTRGIRPGTERAARRMAPADGSFSVGAEPPPTAPRPEPPLRDLGAATDTGAIRTGEADEGEPLRDVETSAAADFPPVVSPGEVYELAYRVGGAATGQIATVLSTRVPQSVRRLDLTVLVQAANFDVVDPKSGQLASDTASVSLDLDNPAALETGVFHLRAKNTGQRVSAMIRLRFLHNNAPIGTIKIPTIITPESQTSATPVKSFDGSIHYAHQAPPGPELLLVINRDASGDYQITATLDAGLGRSIARAKLGGFPVTGEAWEYAKTILEEFRDASSEPETRRKKRIDRLGLDLWRQLPDAFRRFYWEHVHDHVETILVCSEEPYIPWELIRPEREAGGETAPMLGEAFAMARWDDEQPTPNPIEVDEFVVVAPAYTTNRLAYAEREATELVERFGARRVDPGAYDQVIELLEASTLQVLHFSGHGEFRETPNDSTIQLADDTLDIFDVNGARFAQQPKRPLVFLNACEVGSQGWSLTQIGGWAQAFVGAGSAAFVGPYWAVSDRVAYKAALRFYGDLEQGMTIGEAMRDIRSQFHEDAEDRYHPSWLAYSLHCHPNVTVTI